MEDEHELTVRLVDNGISYPAYRGVCSCGRFESTLCGRVALIGEEFDEHIQDELTGPMEIEGNEDPENVSPEMDWEAATAPSIFCARD